MKIMDVFEGRAKAEEIKATRTGNVLSIQSLDYGQAAHLLAEMNPEYFTARQVAWRLVRLEKLK